jgi:hypothetical protein
MQDDSLQITFLSALTKVIGQIARNLNLTTNFSGYRGEQMHQIEQGVGTETDSVRKSVMKTMSWRIVATSNNS